MKIFEKTLGQNIRRCRKNKNLSQQTLAEMVGVEPTTVSHMERGSTNPSLRTFINIANALDVSADDLLYDIIENSKQGVDDRIKLILENLNTEEINKLL